MEKLREFMEGRYGFDKLGLALIVSSFALSLLSRLFRLFFLQYVCIVLDIIFIYRFLSRKEFARSRENRIFLELFDKAADFFSKDRANYRYCKCPVCKTRFSTPKNHAQGFRIVCPKCGNEFK
ncbi:MAG TPA: FYDLN acid domain-containing protein [Candidatus Monoglobus merdigallinarum]|uniref:FYDLN acid domain-containing protein n=1 Tax=Candidatus Monoglobus merdigallinarum TaxID=2838698 RepID=A0A9D1TM22_9FIRM|nr:FYDLN acid domain-containing protein [Candidatus Monoglobus merdigallinarum]